MKAVITGLALLMAVPAVAQDGLPYDEDVLPACLMFRANLSEREDCIGLAANRCQYNGAGSSNAGISACLAREADQWDARLNNVYAKLKKQEADEDAGAKAENAPGTDQEARLVEMQRNWIAFRDAACMFEHAQWGGGSGGGVGHVSCVMEQTARQALRLESYLSEEWR